MHNIQEMINWNHNTHYHRLLLKELPDARGTALDIGSGLGLYASRLSSEFDEVAGLEPDRASIDLALARCRCFGNVDFVEGGFLEHDFRGRRFDYISAIASIHHMDFAAALEKMCSLLNPGGRLAILGLYRESGLQDLLISAAAVLPNLVMNLLAGKGDADDSKMVTSAPELSLGSMRGLADALLGEYRLRRHLFWRYSLIFDKNAE